LLTPEYLLHVSEGAEEIAEQLHRDIIDRIIDRMMVRIGRGDDYLLTSTDKWNLDVLQDAGYLLEDIQKEIIKATKIQEREIKEAFEEAGVKALEYDDKTYQKAGLSTTPLTQSPNLVRLMQRCYEATMGEWRNFTRTTANASQQAFIKAVDKAYTLTTSGTVSYTQAVKEAVNDIVSEGVEVRYPTGHKDSLETATLRAVRTGVSQATGAIQMARMEEMDWDIVLTSAHIGARSGDGGMNPSNHLWWQGQFFSRTGRTPGLPLFVESTGYGTVEGLCGANCRHSFGPGDGEHNPFEDISKEENYEVEKLQKRQRALERRIRKTKREVMGLKKSIDSCTDPKAKYELDLEYQRKSALLSKQNKAYNEFCEKNGLKRLADRLEIAKWDRQQAAEARGAAKRYKNAKEVEKIYISDIMKTRNISQRNLAIGLRRSPSYILNDKEIESILNDAKSIGVPEDILRFNYGSQTGFSDRDNMINVRGDILPDMSSRNVRDLLSSRAVLAHEYYGHYKQHPSSFWPGDWRDEFRASYRAAIDTPNLTDEERRMLMLDAYDRAKEAGVPAKYNKEARRIIYGYDD